MKKIIFILLLMLCFSAFSDTYTQDRNTTLILNMENENTFIFVLETAWGAMDSKGRFVVPADVKTRIEFGKAVKEKNYYVYSGYNIFDEDKTCEIKFFLAKTNVNVVSNGCNDSEFKGFSGKFSNIRKSTGKEMEELERVKKIISNL